MDTPKPEPQHGDLMATVSALAQRIERIEHKLGLDSPPPAAPAAVKEPLEPMTTGIPSEDKDSLEFEVGSNWFGIIGIIVLALGIAFVLSLPFEQLPPALPSLAGYVLCAGLLVVARFAEASFELIAKYLRRAGILLLFYATLRLFHFGAEPALDIDGTAARGLFLAVAAFNLGLAWMRRSPHLFGLALVTGFAGPVVAGSTGFLFGTATALCVITALAQSRMGWRLLTPLAFALAMIGYLIWAIGNPVAGGAFAINTEFTAGPYFIPGWILILSAPVLFRPDSTREDAPVQINAVVLCGFGFLTLAFHNLVGHPGASLIPYLAASICLLVLATAFWIREQSWFSTFIYAMTGYMALSFALFEAFEAPEIFVALSLQSLVVVVTAIWFRSPFIVVANSLIFIGIIGGYIAVPHAEQGMSIGFGIVALVSARILNWKKDRLTLKTELMRNAYLAIAFCIFPYALYYLVPENYVAVAWVGMALVYYALNLIVRNRKYRWMGHMTLLLTVLYVLLFGAGRLSGTERILSFLVLGTILLSISLIFTLRRAKRQSPPEEKKVAE